MTVCWFCDTKAADPDAAVQVGFHKYGSSHRRGKTVVTEVERVQVPVPRCKDCEERTYRAGRRNMIAGTLFIAFAAGGFLLRAVYPDLGTFYRWAFPCGGLLLGAIVGVAISMAVGDVEEGIKPTKAALEHAAVKAMQERPGWQLDDGWK